MYKHKLISKKPQLGSPSKKKQNKENNNEDSDDDKWAELVTCEDNHIYFYDHVNAKNILTLIKYIKNLNIKLLLIKTEFEIKYNSATNLSIYLHINSCGGYITDALAGVDCIKNSKVPIISIVEGYAASAATFLSMVCNTRQITSSSCMLIHQLSGITCGTYDQMNDDHTNNILLQNKIRQLYLENSNNKLTNKKLDVVLKHDLMWDANKCLASGLVDEII